MLRLVLLALLPQIGGILLLVGRHSALKPSVAAHMKKRTRFWRVRSLSLGIFFQAISCQATFGERLRELRWKNSAWLATADTIAGWNGFEIRNAGSGRSPVRKRSG